MAVLAPISPSRAATSQIPVNMTMSTSINEALAEYSIPPSVVDAPSQVALVPRPHTREGRHEMVGGGQQKERGDGGADGDVEQHLGAPALRADRIAGQEGSGHWKGEVVVQREHHARLGEVNHADGDVEAPPPLAAGIGEGLRGDLRLHIDIFFPTCDGPHAPRGSADGGGAGFPSQRRRRTSTGSPAMRTRCVAVGVRPGREHTSVTAIGRQSTRPGHRR